MSPKKGGARHQQREPSARPEQTPQLSARLSPLTRRELLPLAGAVALAALLAFVGLSNQRFWDDEANTALFARSVLANGKLAAWDGTNVIGFRQGAELDENLINVYMPPVQYYVAAVGLALFGHTTFGGRSVFVLCGLLALVALFWWTRWHLRGLAPPWLPALFTALSPAYLMYIRQCRYYALAVLLSVTILALYAHVKETRRSLLVTTLCAGLCAIVLMLTNYLNAAALAGILPLFLLLPRYRNKAQYIFLAALYGAFFVAGIYVLVTANPFAAAVAPKDSVTGLAHYGTLLKWHLAGLGSFEFFPLLIVLFLVTPFAVAPWRAARPLAREGLLLALALLGYIVVTVLFSPQPVGMTHVADMRYVVPLIPVGALATVCAIMVLWPQARLLGRVAAVVVCLLVGGTNVLSLGFIGNQPLTSTLYRYVRENLHDYTTGTETLIDYLAALPQGKVVQIMPDFMTYAPMFYTPGQHYCCQLRPDHPLSAALRTQLPDYVFSGRVPPDYVLAGGNTPPQQVLAYYANMYGAGAYRIKELLPDDWRDKSRPEIPWHSFGPPGEGEGGRARGFVVLERVTQ
jgi:hypothetical protein